MKLNKFSYLYSKPLGNHTLKIMKKIPGNLLKKPGKIMEISWNFVSRKKWEPCLLLSKSLHIDEEALVSQMGQIMSSAWFAKGLQIIV